MESNTPLRTQENVLTLPISMGLFYWNLYETIKLYLYFVSLPINCTIHRKVITEKESFGENSGIYHHMEMHHNVLAEVINDWPWKGCVTMVAHERAIISLVVCGDTGGLGCIQLCFYNTHTVPGARWTYAFPPLPMVFFCLWHTTPNISFPPKIKVKK